MSDSSMVRQAGDGMWQTSSHCASNECVQVALGDVVQVRDYAGTVLSFTPAAWTAFLRQVHNC